MCLELKNYRIIFDFYLTCAEGCFVNNYVNYEHFYPVIGIHFIDIIPTESMSSANIFQMFTFEQLANRPVLFDLVSVFFFSSSFPSLVYSNFFLFGDLHNP